jgi:hypothetical protein
MELQTALDEKMHEIRMTLRNRLSEEGEEEADY